MLSSTEVPTIPPIGSEVKCEEKLINFPPQHQDTQPGLQYLMVPQPIVDNPNYRAAGKLAGKVAIITGGDSGIGSAAAIAFAKEGCTCVIPYFDETIDALNTLKTIEKYGGKGLLIPGDLRDEKHCQHVIEMTIKTYGRLDVLIINQGVQFPQKSIEDISTDQLLNTFATNIFPHFFLTKYALPYLKPGSTIVCTASVTAYKGTPLLLDYSSSKGAIVSFIRSLSLQLVDRGIRVNGIAPGPIWTSLIVSSYDAKYVSTFGYETPMGRAGQPFELAPAYVYLACEDSSFMTGQLLHINGGIITST